MLKIVSHNIAKKAQSFFDEIEDVDYGEESEFEETPGVVNEHNLGDYLTDDVEEDSGSFLDEIPMGIRRDDMPEGTREISYSSPSGLISDAITRVEVISFEYTNRFGQYSGIRTVEPHYTFIAYTTGNEVLVTFDRSVGDIRAFIVGNIHPNGVRYENDQFVPRQDIMVGVN